MRWRPGRGRGFLIDLGDRRRVEAGAEAGEEGAGGGGGEKDWGKVAE